jgi:hypothetical protein
MEPGKLRESGMSSIDDAPDTADGAFLDISVLGRIPTLSDALQACLWPLRKLHLP